MFETIHLIKTNGRHGYEDEIVTILGDACGVIMQYEYEKTLYIAGDTVWCDEVDKAILSEEELTDLHDIIDKMDGIILTGGLVSNNYEQEIASYCIKKNIPLLGICAGFNNMIRALRGKTHLDNSGLHKQYGSRIAHNIVINRDSKLYQILKNDNIMVNSIHTYITTKEEVNGYEIAATCPIDNTIEAIEMPDKKFVMGIKWHPELMDNMNEIFKFFIDNCH